jgi:hypothetical protein
LLSKTISSLWFDRKKFQLWKPHISQQDSYFSTQ